MEQARSSVRAVKSTFPVKEQFEIVLATVEQV